MSSVSPWSEVGPVSDRPLRPAARSTQAGHRPALLLAWNRTVRLYGEQRAVVQACDGTALTFRELDARAESWRRMHVPEPAALRGRAVVFAVANGPGWLEMFLGLLQAGAVVVPLDAAEPAAAQRQLAESLRAGFWWTDGKLAALAGAKRFRDPAVCLLKVTSGTTGRPRALAFTAGQLLADARNVTATMGIDRRDLSYAMIPFGHAYGLGNLTIPMLAQGVPLVCGTAPLPHAIAADFARWRPTVFPGVPTLWRALAGSDLTLPGLRLAISAGAPLAPAVAQEFATRFGRRLHSLYGSSETGAVAYDRTGAATLAGAVGPALRGVSLTALGGARLWVSSAAVLTLGNRRRSGRLGAWIMPDRVVLDDRGGVTLLGRRGQTVKIAGRRVNLAEVTARLRQVAGVQEAWVALTPGPEPVLAAVVATGLTAAGLRATLRADTASWKIPRKLIVVAGMPVTARGKTDTRALQAMVG